MKKEKWFGLLLAVGLIVLLMVQPADSKKGADPTVDHIRATMTAVNQYLEAIGENFRLGSVEYYTAWDKAGMIVFSEDRIKQSDFHWVPGDYRRDGRNDITWISDQVDGIANGLLLAETQDAVDRAMATWEGVKCSNIPLVQLFSANDFGLSQLVWATWYGGYGGSFEMLADITHCGWLSGDFFEWKIGPGASNYVLGATITWYFIEGNLPTDIDNNGKFDVAFREIYYNNEFPWAISTDWPIDVETVVLHEAGHGLSQDHFEKLFLTDANGKLHFAPRAVMNSGYSGVQQVLRGTDNGGHCSIWAAWPNK